MSKYCPECGNKAQGAKFCGECGYSFLGIVSQAQTKPPEDSQPDIDYSQITFSYKTTVDANSTRKFGEVAQEEKTGFSRAGGRYSKEAGKEFLNKIRQKTEIGGGDDE
jgi:hypothetical protein